MPSDHGEFDVIPTESETTCTVGNFPCGDMYVSGESDNSIGPRKRTNKDSLPLSAESVEGRGVDQGERRAVATGPHTAPGF
jgi:hypothetical protein